MKELIIAICMNEFCENESLKNNDYCYNCSFHNRKDKRKDKKIYEQLIIFNYEYNHFNYLRDFKCDKKYNFKKVWINDNTYKYEYCSLITIKQIQ